MQVSYMGPTIWLILRNCNANRQCDNGLNGDSGNGNKWYRGRNSLVQTKFEGTVGTAYLTILNKYFPNYGTHMHYSCIVYVATCMNILSMYVCIMYCKHSNAYNVNKSMFCNQEFFIN